VTSLVLNGCSVATVNPQGAEYAAGHVLVDGRRIAAVGPGPAPAGLSAARYVDAAGWGTGPANRKGKRDVSGY